jgi:hypothetical protein
MNKMIFDRNKLHLAEVKYFDIKHNGIELTDPAAVAIIYGEDGQYINPLCHYEEFPTFKRSCVPNYNGSTNEYFGSKVVQLTEECSTGPCWLIRDNNDFKDKLDEQVTLEELEEYVLASPYYFKDRLDIAKARLRKFERPFAMTRIIRRDKESYEEYLKFFDSRKSDLSREFIKTRK